MISRRLLEILACGGICVTNANPAVEKYFSAYCHVVRSEEDAFEILGKLAYGPTRDDLERAAAGAKYVAERHTWQRRLEQLEDLLNF